VSANTACRSLKRAVLQSPNAKKDDIFPVCLDLRSDFTVAVAYAWDFGQSKEYTRVRRALNSLCSNGDCLAGISGSTSRPSPFTSPPATPSMTYQTPFYAFTPGAPPVLPQAYPIVSTIQTPELEAHCDPGMQAATSWEQSIPFATHPLSFSPPNHITYHQSDVVASPDFWGPIPSPPISVIAPNSNASWTGQDEPSASEDEIPMQSISRCRSGYQCQVPVGDTGRACGHVFSRRDRALTHVRVHFGMRPYNCQGACGIRGW